MNLPNQAGGRQRPLLQYVIDNILSDDCRWRASGGPEAALRASWPRSSTSAVSPSVRRSRSWSIWGAGRWPGDGTYVKNTSAQSLVSKMNFSFDAMADTIRDLLELRIVLETFAAYHAAQRRTDEISPPSRSCRDM